MHLVRNKFLVIGWCHNRPNLSLDFGKPILLNVPPRSPFNGGIVQASCSRGSPVAQKPSCTITSETEKTLVAKNLLIVESPGKIKTISKVLGKSFVVKASIGHVRDITSSKSGGNKDF